MFKFLKFVKNVLSLNKRMTEEEQQQKKDGYSIKKVFEGGEHYLVYRAGDKEVTTRVEFITNSDSRLSNTFVKWDKPRGEELTPFDYQMVTNRFVKYLSCWGGEVIVDNSPVQDFEQLKISLMEQGIEFEELDDQVVVYESTVEDEKKRRNSPFN